MPAKLTIADNQSQRMKHKSWVEKWGISASALWILAMIFLLMDHFGAAYMELGVLGGATEAGMDLYSPYMMPDLLLRLFGAIAFPLIAFLFVEGFRKTDDIKTYALKTLTVAVVAEIPFDLAFYMTPIYLWHQNLFFTLLLGLVVLVCLKRFGKNMVTKILVLLAGCALTFFIRGDRGLEGIVIICAMYMLWDRPLLQFAFCAMILIQNPLAPLSLLAFLPIRLYDGTNYEKLQNIFYIFYPVHILLLYFLRIAVFGT